MIKNTLLIGALWAGLAVSTPALAQDAIEVASDGCFARGQAVADQRGATFVSAETVQRDGQTVCRIVLLHQAEDGQRPRKEEVFVDQ